MAAVIAVVLVATLGARAAHTGTPPAGFQESVVFSGLTNPTVVRFAPDGRVFVAEKSGLIKVFDGLTDATPTVFADLRTNVYNFWDRGLLGLALAPNFPTSPYVYVTYTYDHVLGDANPPPKWGTAGATSDPCPSPPGATSDGCVVSARLSRLQAEGDTMTGTEQVLIEDWCQQYPSHSIGAVEFGPDGMLYVTAGEGASFTLVDYGQNGSPLNPCGDPPGGVGATLTAPTAEGGALRSQDLRTTGDPVTLDGAVLRVDPSTGAAASGNPLATHADPNARRIIAYGLRNPFRFAFRPGTSELWIGDVGWGEWEEINRIPNPTDSVIENFGWPCYEGNPRQPGYDAANLDICEDLSPSAVTGPFFAYQHISEVVPGETCPIGSSSISGLSFEFSPTASTYPPAYQRALFFADYSRDCIWVIKKDANGVPAPGLIETFVADAANPVNLEFGPGGDLFYVDFDGGTIRRIAATTAADKAAGKPASASSIYGAGFEPGKAVDGSSATRWSSAFADSQWWQVDLGGTHSVDSVTLNWEDAYASRYQVLTSLDGTSFTLAAEETISTPNWKTTSFTARNARYVRVLGITRATPYGISFWDAQVFGPADSSSSPPESTAPPPIAGSAQQGQTLTASSGTWTNSPSSFAYQWQRCDSAGTNCSSIAGATATIYRLTATEVGSTIRVRVTAANAAGSGTATSSQTAIVVEDKAAGKPASASSIYGAGFEPGKAVDDTSATRWSSAFADSQWWQVDLGTARSVDSVTLNWEIAYASQYQILTSPDGTSFTLAAEETIGTPGWKTTSFTTRNARYVRVLGITRATPYGISFWDAQVVGPADSSDTTRPTVTTVTPGDAAIGVVTTSNVTASFSEPMDPTTISVSTFTLIKQGTPAIPVAAVVNYDAASQTATLNPNSDLDAGGTYTATVKGGAGGVKDVAGNALASDVSWTFTTAAGTNQPPAPVIDSPPSTTTWKVGDSISFSGHATDPEQGDLPASALSWKLLIQHCPSTCHAHTIQTWSSVASDSFSAPDHEYPSYLELELTATDSSSATATTTVRLDPMTAVLTFVSTPSGLQLAVNGASSTTQFTRTVIRGSTNSVSAATPQTSNGCDWAFGSWSDGGAQTHQIVATASTTYAATYIRLPCPPRNTSLPIISGSAVEGNALAAQPGSWVGALPITFGYQWLRCNKNGAGCGAIGGATGSSYTLTASDVGRRVRVTVTATNSDGAVSATSETTAVVKRR